MPLVRTRSSRTAAAHALAGLAAALLFLAPFGAPRAQATATRPPAMATRAPERPITTHEIDGHLRFLSSDLLEGRAPSTRGGRLAAEYIAAQLRLAGVEPAGTDGYYQPVPIDVVSADTSTMRAAASGKATRTLRHPDEVVLWAGSAAERSQAHGELVFVGYGVTAPEQRWDDFKDVDVKGKILLILVNDPPATAAEPQLFGGRAMTYYGRWTYKFEEAERRGAAGALIVHVTEQAGYPWPTVVGSWAKEQYMLPRDPSLPAPLGARGWITARVANSMLRDAGLELQELVKQAESRDFRPVATGIDIDLAFDNRVQRRTSENVVGVVRGTDARLREQHVALTSHWDHLGIGPAVNGDSIYNGASDNASGVADLLAVARAAAEGPAPRRSLLFVFVTAEESGLLGSQYFAENPTVPLERIVANVNVDGGNLLGRTSDIVVLGEKKSTLGVALSGFVYPMGLTLSPEARPEVGSFYRTDHFSFAKAGVPAISIGAGTQYVGRPDGWAQQQQDEYIAQRYHRPADEYRADFDLSGAVQLSNVLLRFARFVANEATLPAWAPDAEFRRPVVQ